MAMALRYPLLKICYNGLDFNSAKKHESLCINNATGIITVTALSQDILINTYGTDIKNKCTTIRHGCPEQKTTPTIPVNKHIFKIAYTGQLRGINIANEATPNRFIKTCIHNILSITIGKRQCHQLKVEWMSPHYIIEAMAMVAKQHPEFS